jgi:arylsulfate sulfotransferase
LPPNSRRHIVNYVSPQGRCLLLICLAAIPPALAQNITLQPSRPSPWQVGGVVTWTATPSTGDLTDYWYRFRVRRAGSPYRVWRDYGPSNTFEWTDADYPGNFDIEVAARDRDKGSVSVATARYVLLPNTTDRPVLIETPHPLVLLYSAAPCPAGARMKVRFQALDGFTQDTPFKPCIEGLGMNFYLGGLRAETEYVAYHIVDTGDTFETGFLVGKITGSVNADLPDTTVLKAAPLNSPSPIVLQENVFASQLATDLAGQVVWYYPAAPLSFMTRPTGEGTFFGIMQDPQGDPWQQTLREFNLIGLAIRETNAGRVNEQLRGLGKHTINAFHHEALRLPDGNIAVVGGVEQILSNVQGAGPVNILGDMVIVLDPNLNVVWAWDAFDHLDPHRKATQDDQCLPNACPPLQLGRFANDWTHVNAVEATADGNLLVSVRNQDWIVKIAYDSGEGGGDVLWRLGPEGDFKLTTGDQNQWFTHQHDPRFEPGSTDRLMVLDNGNTRHGSNPAATSRGQVYQLDEAAKTATVAVNDDLGRYSLAVGSTERLTNGNYWFDAGFLPDASGITSEFDSAGRVVFSLRTAAPVYRSYRLTTIYGSAKGNR